MSKKAVEAVFEGLFILSDIRGILRETAPHHQFSPEEKILTAKNLEKLEKQVSILREELLA
jgi:hypothetical protein